MNRLVKELLLLPAPAMPGDERITEHKTDFVDGGNDGRPSDARTWSEPSTSCDQSEPMTENWRRLA